MLIILCAKDGESSQNCSSADQTGSRRSTRSFHSAELLNGTVLCQGEELGQGIGRMSDVIAMEREKVKKVSGDGMELNNAIRLKFITRMHHQISEN